jgi:protease I
MAGELPLLDTTFTEIKLRRNDRVPKLNGIRIAILATDGVEQAELTEPRKFLEDNGAETILISPKSGEIQAMKHDEKADKFKVDLELSQADPEDFDAVLLPGGALNADALRMEEDARSFVQEMDETEKPLAVICHGPWLLISADLTEGRRLTSYHTIQDDLRNAGAEWDDQETVRDRNWVSSRQPSDIPAFNEAFRELLEMAASKRSAA